jgi:hypothetical protein
MPYLPMVKAIAPKAPMGATFMMMWTTPKTASDRIYLTSAIFVFLILGAVARYNGFSIIKLIRYIKEGSDLHDDVDDAEDRLGQDLDEVEDRLAAVAQEGDSPTSSAPST